jgi:hypothetical protein
MATSTEESMQKNSMTGVCAAAIAALGILLAAGSATASGRNAPPPSQADPSGSTVGRPGPTSSQANYHADYRVKSNEPTATQEDQQRNEKKETQSPLRSTTNDRLGRTPFAWPR